MWHDGILLVKRLAYKTAGISHMPMRPGEIPGARVVADTSTLLDVGIDPQEFVSLQDGVTATVRWFAENEGITWHKSNN